MLKTISAIFLIFFSSLSFAEDDVPDEVKFFLLKRYQSSSGEIRYFSGSVDLNGDNQPEIIVYVIGPLVCGTGGCSTYVFSGKGEKWHLVSRISITKPPILVLDKFNHGWKDIVVRTGGAVVGRMSVLHFDGKKYPFNPSVPPAEKTEDTTEGMVVIKKFGFFTEGNLLYADKEKVSQ